MTTRRRYHRKSWDKVKSTTVKNFLAKCTVKNPNYKMTAELALRVLSKVKRGSLTDLTKCWVIPKKSQRIKTYDATGKAVAVSTKLLCFENMVEKLGSDSARFKLNGYRVVHDPDIGLRCLDRTCTCINPFHMKVTGRSSATQF